MRPCKTPENRDGLDGIELSRFEATVSTTRLPQYAQSAELHSRGTLGRIGTTLRICGRTMRSYYPGHEAPSLLVLGSYTSGLPKPRATEKGFPIRRFAPGSVLFWYNRQDRDSWPVKKTGLEITHMPKV
jgi:hypothetical protein